MASTTSSADVAAPDRPELLYALDASAQAVDRLLRALDDTDDVTAGGEWTVRETAAHLVAGARLYASLLAGAPSPVVDRASNAPLNAGVFLALAERRPPALADLLATAVEELRIQVGAVNPEEIRPWHRGLSMPAVVHVALMVNELLMHGTDIARASGAEWDGDDRAAHFVWQVLVPLLTPLRFLPEVAPELRVTIALAAHGRAPVGYAVTGPAIAVAEPGSDTECHIEGPPMALLRWYFQRDPWPVTDLRASGPRADIAAQFANLLRRL